jgi:stage V sporulation protein D (sporulation-specific penicillin-binding protein)
MKHWRTHLVLLLLFVMAAALVGRLVFLQVVHYGFYKALAQGQQNSSSLLRGQRGSIFIQDKQGDLHTLAGNQKVPFVFASPPEVEDTEQTAAVLAESLQVDLDSLLVKLNHMESLYEPIKKEISPAEEAFLEQAEIPGIYIGRETKRAYPQGDLASHVTGFTNQDGQGQYGIEEQYNDVLEGKEGLKKSARNPASYLMAAFQDTLKDGSDVVLTIDYHIQSMAESLLQDAARQLNTSHATVIVIDPLQGNILALANYPSFDPNKFSDVENLRVFQNGAVQTIFEPGSIFKPITMASALDAGKVTPQTTYVDQGVVQIGGRKVLNYDERVWGLRSMTEVLEFSINTGVVFAEQQLGHQKFLDYIEKFGIFEPTDIDLAGEVYSKNTEFQKGYEINFTTASFGQGIEMTPMQIVKAFTALANGGIPVTPYIVQGNKSDEKLERAISERTSSQITAMLTSVVENGFGKAARIPGYYVAGKTGTAQVSWSALGVSKAGYSDQTIQSFIGYVPAFDPKFLILVKLDNPQARTAEYSALPVFRDLAKYIIDYYQIPPDYDIE